VLLPVADMKAHLDEVGIMGESGEALGALLIGHNFCSVRNLIIVSMSSSHVCLASSAATVTDKDNAIGLLYCHCPLHHDNITHLANDGVVRHQSPIAISDDGVVQRLIAHLPDDGVI
jgi:hypothetical protein